MKKLFLITLLIGSFALTDAQANKKETFFAGLAGSISTYVGLSSLHDSAIMGQHAGSLPFSKRMLFRAGNTVNLCGAGILLWAGYRNLLSVANTRFIEKNEVQHIKRYHNNKKRNQ